MSDTHMRRAELTIERTFDAPRERVWRAMTHPEELARWIWAGMGGEPWAEVDLRVGGAWRAYTRFPGGRHQGEGWSGMCGLYVVVEPPARLVFTLHWDADVGYNRPDALTLDEVVSVVLVPDGAGTRLTYTHTGIPDDGRSAATHRQGEAASLELLARVLGEAPGPA